MLYWDDATLIEKVFHELAHERLYVADDTAFNESYATFVGREGLRQWRAVSDDAPPVEAAQRCRRADFVALVSETRANLEAVYAQDAPDAVMLAAAVPVTPPPPPAVLEVAAPRLPPPVEPPPPPPL